MMLTLNGITDLSSRIGQELGVSAWHTVTQQKITAFAESTEDFERIHLDSQRGREAGLGGTIAHGLYTLSLGPKFLYEIFTMQGVALGLNYGFERVRFLTPVPAESRIRMAAVLAAATPITGGTKFTVTQTFEIDGYDKPACVADSILAYFH